MSYCTKIKRSLLLILAFLIIHFFADAQVASYIKTNYGISCKLKQDVLNIYILKDNVTEVKYTNLGMLEAKQSLVALPISSYEKSFSVAEKDGNIIFTTAKLKIDVNKNTQAITYSDLNNNIILAETNEANKVMRDTTVADIQTYSCATSFRSPADEGLFGLGCHPLDSSSINYKGRDQNMAIKYLTGAVPVLLSTKGYGLLWDNYAESNFYGAENNNTQYTYISESGKMVDYYFF